MIYKLIRPIFRLASKLYFRKIYIDGLENIPEGKPVILVSNHPTAFLEPCLYACFLPLDLHFLVRGDLFSKNWLSWLLKGTNQIPIFRHKDGLNNVRKNLMTQEAVKSLFAAKKCLLMFPEGHTQENLYLKPLKKGLARFSFMDHGADVEILPVGINFDRNVKFNSKVSLVVGQALNVNEFRNQEFETDARMSQALLKEVAERMKKCIRHIDNEERESLIHESFSFMDTERKESVIPTVSYSKDVFLEEKEMAASIDKDDRIYEKIQKFFRKTKNSNIAVPNYIDSIFMLLLLPIFSLGILIHGLPVLFVRNFIRNKITAHEFKSPVFLSALILLYLIFILLSIILGLVLNINILFGFVIAMVVGSLTIIYSRAYGKKWKYFFSRGDAKNEFKEKKELWDLSMNK